MSTFEPIAIVGEGCILPGASSPRALWEVVLEGRSALSRGEHAFGTGIGGYVRDFERAFDPEGFLVAADRLRALDPVFSWTLHAAREAMRSAGMKVGEPRRAGLVLGNLSYPTPGLSAFARHTLRGGETADVDPRNRFMSGLPAALVAEALGLAGGGFGIDAACASSLYAIKLACDRLHDGDADVMLAGGTNHTGDTFLHAGFLALGALSATGQSRPFHRDADGLVPAQGAAVVVLKRLADAEASSDAILGVIRGIGLSNDGRSRGLLVPSEDGQLRAMRAAYAMSGLSPADISFVECHATGTQVGDAMELRSLREVFTGVRDVPIGSLKANLGHLITASGAAGLIKVLAAMRARVRPPTLRDGAPLAEDCAAPLRVLREPEAWTCDGPRRAAISNFGFGGNNAHLVVEEWTGAPRSQAAARASTARQARPEIVIVAKAVLAGAAQSTEAFDAAVLEARSSLGGQPPEARASSFELEAGDLRFPPADLRESLAQQLVLLRLAAEIASVAHSAAPERTAVLIGMQVDGEVTRHSLRIDAAAAARSPKTPLTAAATIGCMPNVVANRINHQLDLRAPSFTVSAEEASGTVALDLAMRSLAADEIDVAVVGAVDLSCEPVHAAAARALLPEGRRAPGDAAVLFVLKRLADARRDGDRVLAILGGDDRGLEPRLRLALGADQPGLSGLFGHAHATSGLLHVAAAVTSCEQRALPARPGNPAVPWLPIGGERRARVDVAALGGMVTRTSLRVDHAAAVRGAASGEPCVALFGGADHDELLRALERGAPTEPSAFRVAIVAANEAALPGRIERARALLLEGVPATFTVLDDGIYFGRGALDGEVAFVFTGPAGAYPHMGRDLAMALPELVDALAAKSSTVGETVGFLYDEAATFAPSTQQKLFASSYLAYLHGELTRGLLGIAPHASIGYCAGETNALFAMGAWTDFDGFQRAIDDSGVFTRELAGDLVALRRAWQSKPGDDVQWTTYRVLAPLDTVRAALSTESRAHLTIINSRTDVIIAGDPEACARVVAILGPQRARSLGYDMVMHCPEARAHADGWHALHHRPTAAVPGVRFYTHATCASYELSDTSVADALTEQAMRTVDFPAMVEKAYADGVRVFVEHGPHAGCTKWIDDVLGARPHLAVALDRFGRSSLLQAMDSIAALLAAGVAMDHRAVVERLGPAARRTVTREAQRAAPPLRRSLPLRFEAHPDPEPTSPAIHEDGEPRGEIMAPAPRLPPSRSRFTLPAPSTHVPAPQAERPRARIDARTATPSHVSHAEPAHAGNAHASSAHASSALPGLGSLVAHQAALADLHTEFLRQQASVQAHFVSLCFAPLAAPASPRPAPAPRATPAPHAPPTPTPRATPTPPLLRVAAAAPPRPTAPRSPLGPRFDRAQLETLASGRISSVLGPLFAQQDGFARQVRMPEPPLLLADRVTGIDAEPGTMGVGTIWTETDVTPDAWYLHEGRVPAGIFVEAGQADLLLVSWLGSDFQNRGERVYRLLGCELETYGQLPTIGDTLAYEIRIDSHARSGDIHIFSFSSECWIDGELRMRVRNGQAGFFTDQELAGSTGVRWSAEDARPIPEREPRLAAPAVRCAKASFTSAEISAFIAGRADQCFGPGFARAATHTRTPSIQGERMRLVDEITHFDPAGGPWGRGMMRARLPISADHWFFAGHFKNDPCMPGTLLLDGSLQAMSIYLAALGYTLPRDGWRFEMVPEEPYVLRCRGQTTPASKELIYEIFVHEIIDGPMPTIYADVLGIVDGLKAFHVRRLGLRLVPGWPYDIGRLALPAPAEGKVAVTSGGVVFDEQAMLNCALGRPSLAQGEDYRRFDGALTLPRLPGPPYLLISRVLRLEGGRNAMQLGSVAEVEYDLTPDAWFFEENGRKVVPFGVLLEIALQPCGSLATYAGCVLAATEPVSLRNLDGTGTVYAEVPSDVRTLTTTVTLTSLSSAGSLMIVAFECVTRAGELVVYRAKTVFGFFTLAAMVHQVGLPTDAAARARLGEPSSVAIDLRERPARFFEGPLRAARGPKLLMVDRISGLWREGGAAGLGRIRTEKDIRPSDWFFKAHFFQDPVQPGSLGLEAMVQALELLLIERGLGRDRPAPRFDAGNPDVPMTWKYRGQVVPENELVTVDLELTELREEATGLLVIARASLWVDGKRIYEAKGLSTRIVSG